jgi:ribonuclease BN (tRNA processing enzyme)
LPGDGTLRHFPLVHPGGSVGFRLDWPGHSLAYVTDTTTPGACAGYVDQIRNVDLLVHECNYPDGMEEMAELTGHSCATPVAQTARAAGVKRLVLTHVNPATDVEDPIGMPAIRKVFPGAELGYDGMLLDF